MLAILLKPRLINAALLLVALCLGACSERPNKTDLLTIQGRTMGTNFLVKIVEDRNVRVQERLAIEQQINRLLAEVNQQMSTYLPDSEISLFNQYRGTDWFQISKDFAIVLQRALEISHLSNGSFDITVGPLVNLWGFGPEKRDEVVPSTAEIEERRSSVGYKKLTVTLSPPAIMKSLPELYCDLSAIAKGFGVDKVSDYLEGLGAKNYMVEIGGEVRVKGKSPTGVWRIGVERPDDPTGLQAVIEISDNAMATSGDYFNYFEKDGVRYSHTIDPITGRPIIHKLASVTIIHPLCTMADGLATAINVMGPDAGYEFALQQNLPVLMIVRGEDGFVEKMTPQFKKYFN